MTVAPFGDTVLQVKVAPQGKEGIIIDLVNRKGLPMTGTR